jgi:hypothetical protein
MIAMPPARSHSTLLDRTCEPVGYLALFGKPHGLSLTVSGLLQLTKDCITDYPLQTSPIAGCTLG